MISMKFTLIYSFVPFFCFFLLNIFLLLFHLILFSYFLYNFHENFTHFYNFILLFYYISIARNQLNRNKGVTDKITTKVPK